MDKIKAAEELALQFHQTYERLASSFGYETRPDTKVFDPESNNGKLMIAVCSEMLSALSTQSPKWVLCPKCLGDGNLSRYNSPAIVSTSCTPVCDVCNGAKVLLSPSSTHPLQEKIDGLRAGLQAISDEGYDPYCGSHHLIVIRWLKVIDNLLLTYK